MNDMYGWIPVWWLLLSLLHVEILSEVNSWNWFEAQKLCEQHNDSLVNPHTFSSSPNAYWTNTYQRYSSWIKILGCYIDINDNNAYNVQMDTPSAAFCQDICASRNSSIFGIKRECKCFETLPVDKPVSSDYCHTEKRTDRHIKFPDFGGNHTYTLYESDRLITPREEDYCVAVECSPIFKHLHLDYRCSSSLRAVCQNSVLERSYDWWSSRDLCKQKYSSYLAGNIIMNDAHQTCNRLNVTWLAPSWIGVANEVYTGYDRGVPINKEERKSFLRCAKCVGVVCGNFVNCTERLNVVYCEKGFSSIIAELSTTTNKLGTTQSVLYTAETFTKFTTSFSRNFSIDRTNNQDVTDSSNTLSVVIPVVVTIIFIGCFTTAAIFYIRRKRGLGNQNKNQMNSKDTDTSYVNIDATNTDYMDLKPHSTTNYDELHVGQKGETNLYEETAEGMYDQVR